MPRGLGFLYQALVALGLLLAGPILLLLRGRHYLPTLAGRLGHDRRATAASPAGGAVPHERRPLWLHAVSVGEASVAATLAGRLPKDRPLLVTTITPTGQARAASAMAAYGERARVAYLPFDLDGPISRFLARHDPAALVLVEGDFWPLLLARVRRRGVPIAVANGRVSDRTFPRLLRLRSLVLPFLLDLVDRFAVQSPVDRERLLALGVEPSRVLVTGNMKFELPEPPALPELEARLARLAAGRPILVAGSTMPGEEAAVLAAFAAAGGGERALLVVAPRHPERFEAVAALAAACLPGLVRRSGDDRPSPDERPPLFLLDSIGELAAVYRSADGAFVGGSLVPRGGHNPIEPARYGVPVVVGPSMENFREIAELFDREPAWERAANGAALGRIWSDWLAAPEPARAMGERGRRLVESHRGATDRTIAFLAPLLAPAGAPASAP